MNPATSSLSTCPLREEKSFSQNEWAIPIGIAHFLNEIQTETVGEMKNER